MERLRIEKVVHGGFGLSRDGGRVWLVPYTAPGDVIEARAVRERASFVEGECVTVLEPGPDRVEPRCPVYGRCGGCLLQHLSPNAQVAARRGILVESLRRFARVEGLEPEVVTGESWEYRGRLEFHVAASRIGFFARASHALVPVEDCPIAAPEIRRLIPDLGRAVAEARVTGPANIEAVRCSDGKVVLVGDGPPGWFTPALPHHLMEVGGVAGILLHTRGRYWMPMGRTAVSWVVPGPDGDLHVEMDPRGFSQANVGLNARLVETVVRLAGVRPGEEVLELYAGAGNFTLPLLAAGGLVDPPARVTAVESNRFAIEALRKAAAACGLVSRDGALTCLPGKTEVVVRRLWDEHQKFDLIVADPPRAGIGTPARLLPRLGPLRIVLVSCEPTTLARDVATLVEAGYRPDALALVDMFPQTAHVEAVMRLSPDAGRGTGPLDRPDL